MSDLIEQVNALADGELDGAEKEAVLQAIAGDDRAAAEHQWALLFKNHLKDKLTPVSDPDVWQACRIRLDGIDKAKRAEHFVGKYAWAFCLIFLVGLFSNFTLNRMGMSRPLASSHVAGLFNGLTPLTFTEPGQALDAVRANCGMAPRQVVNLGHLRSLELGYVDGRRAARLVVNDGRGDMDLFIVSGTSSIEGIRTPDGGYLCGEINNRRVVSWTDSGCLVMLVAERQSSDLKLTASQIAGR